jgi:Flp pilus assembly protein TadG
MIHRIPISQRRQRSSRGAEIVEFTLILLPMLGFITVLTSMAWGIWAKATLERAVRIGVRTGVTLTSAQMSNGSCLTDVVKSTVQANAFGLLAGASGLSMIKVNFYQPPSATDSTSPVNDVTSQANGNAPGNLMMVSVQGFQLNPLMPRIYGSTNQAPDRNTTALGGVTSMDRIEPSNSAPCKGSAP